MEKIASWINRVVEECPKVNLPKTKEGRAIFWNEFKKDFAKNKKLLSIAKEVKALCVKSPLP